MRTRFNPFAAIGAAASAFWRDVGPAAQTSEGHRDALQRQTRQLGAMWPLALVFTVAAPGIAWWCAVQLAQPGVALVAKLCGGLATGFGVTLLLALHHRAARRWSLQRHVRIATLVGAGIAATLLTLLYAVVGLPAGALRLAAVVAAFAGIIVAIGALQTVRAATLGFAVGLIGVLGVEQGVGPALGIAVLFGLGLTLSTYRLALLDRRGMTQRELDRAQGRMAARLVAEFEAHSNGWFWQTDVDGHITYLTAKVAQELDLPQQPAIGAALTTLFRMDSASPETERTLAFHLSARTAFSNYSVRPASIAKLDRWWSISGRPVTDDLGHFVGFVGSGSDLTERRRADAEITRLALFDGLTGLANRQRLRFALDQVLGQPSSARRSTALFLLDLDRFKAVNDTLGHQTGDTLLKQAAQRLQSTIGEAGLVGRIGGDEFQVILPTMADRDELGALANRVIAELSQPYRIDGSPVSIGCSIGIALSPDDGTDAETLVRNADLALYAAKGDGRGVHRFFRDELLAGAQSRKQLEDDLRVALVGDQFHIVYQPLVGTRSERIVGYEALLRWEHPTRGSISPADFIPVAEDCGLIEAIGAWVLRTACLDAAAWPKDVRVAVNVSPIQFASPTLPSLVTSALAASGIAPDRLELEITEGVFVDETPATDQMFKMLKGCGVRLALDDFGTGYSSLGYLKNAPFDKIKIDQSFVKGATIAGSRNAAIIKAIVTLADTLGMETTAEGVENRDEIALIRDLGCSMIQGYVYGKAARAADVLAQLAAADGMATAIGYRVSRSPRTAMLRRARLQSGDVIGEVRIRNLSSTGAMIDGIEVAEGAEPLDILIELLENEMFAATLRWAADGRAGIEFAETFNMERLAAPPQTLPQAPPQAPPEALRQTG